MSLKFVAVDSVFAALVGKFAVWWLGPVGFFALIGAAFVGMGILVTPVRQRDEARSAVDQLRGKQATRGELAHCCETLADDIYGFLRARRLGSPQGEHMRAVIAAAKAKEPAPKKDPRQDFKESMHKSVTMRMYEERFAGRVYKVVGDLRSGKYISTTEADRLNGPDNVEAAGRVAKQLRRLKRQLGD